MGAYRRPRSSVKLARWLDGRSDRFYGIALVAAATTLWSTAGLYVRFLDLDLWTMQAWRALFAALSLFALIGIANGRRTLPTIRSIGWPGVAAVPISAISAVSYIAALKLTTVANVLVVYATVPLVAASIAFLWGGERITRQSLVASVVALAGIAVMAGAATRPGDIAGNALSFVMTLTFAILLVMVRRFPGLAMAPVNALGAALAAVICWPLMAGGVPSLGELLVLALFGATTTGLSYLLFLTGARYIPSSEAGLVGLIEVVLGPLWVWLAFGEQPGRPAIIGGGLVLAAVVWYLPNRSPRPEQGGGSRAP